MGQSHLFVVLLFVVIFVVLPFLGVYFLDEYFQKSNSPAKFYKPFLIQPNHRIGCNNEQCPEATKAYFYDCGHYMYDFGFTCVIHLQIWLFSLLIVIGIYASIFVCGWLFCCVFDASRYDEKNDQPIELTDVSTRR